MVELGLFLRSWFVAELGKGNTMESHKHAYIQLPKLVVSLAPCYIAAGYHFYCYLESGVRSDGICTQD